MKFNGSRLLFSNDKVLRVKRSMSLLLLVFFSFTVLFSQNTFITTWQTDLPGTSCNSCITIPTVGTGYSYNVDWDNDGVFEETGVTGSITHDFGVPGTYTIQISGSFPRIYFNNSGDSEKLLSIDQWGDISWSGMEKAFAGCVNMESMATDSPDLSFVSSLAWMFEGCTNFNGDVTGWNVANVSDMTGMFSGASSFDHSLGRWMLKSNVILLHMLDHCGISCENYDNTLMGWYNNPATPMVIGLGAAGVNYWLSVQERAYLQVPLCSGGMGWEIIGDSYQECGYFVPFVTTWNTSGTGSSCNSCITIPTTGGGYNYDVDWNNDGIYDQFNVTGSVTHHFGSPGRYTIRIRGDFPRIFFNGEGDHGKLESIDRWGNIEWQTMQNAFKGCTDLTIKGTDIPDLSAVSDMSGMFEACVNLNTDISEWDVSNVTNMSGMFAGASSFDQYLGSWDVGNVTDMSEMFSDASLFNQALSGWNVSKVVDMSGMFQSAISFDQNISIWNVTAVTNMSDMFKNAIAFDGNLGSWMLNSNVNMTGMLDNTGMSCLNYDNSLIGWASKNSTPSNRIVGVQGVPYWLASGERTQLIEQKGWTFAGDYMGDCDYLLPVCTSLSYPPDSSGNVPVNTLLSWHASGYARGYKLTVGTTPGGTELLNNLDVGNVLQFQPESFLPCGSTLFVTIAPYNLKGNSTNCSNVSFSTESVSAQISGDSSVCAGDQASLSASGGTHFLWSPASGLSDVNIPDPIASPETSTTFTVMVSNEGRCEDSAIIELTVHPLPSPNVSHTDESGYQFNNGSATANPIDGQIPFEYYWSNGSENQEITSLSPGFYSVTVSDGNGCTEQDSFEIRAFICPVIEVYAELTDENCFGYCNGEISVDSIVNAYEPITYSWSHGETGPSQKALCAGEYQVAVTDAKNCQTILSFMLAEKERIQFNIDHIGNETGSGNGFIEISIAADSNYIFEWTGPDQFTSASEDIYGLVAGCYALVITDTVSMCQTDTLICIEKATSSEAVSSKHQEILVYPNPAKDHITVDLGQVSLNEGKVWLVSMDGKRLCSAKIENGDRKVILDVGDMFNGLYLIKIERADTLYVKKIEILK